MTDHAHHPETEAEHPDTALVESKVNSGMPNLYDILFLVFLMGMLAMVAWVGVLSHEEGVKNEVTKQNGEAWVKWMKANSEARTKDDFEFEACSASTTERKRWGDCFNALLESENTLKALINPFTKEPVNFVAKCDPKEHASVGGIFLEKLVPTPPGSAIPIVSSQLVDIDPIDAKLSLKLTVCDKGGYAVKVDEFEF